MLPFLCYHPSLLWSIWVLSLCQAELWKAFQNSVKVTLAQSGVLEPTRASSQEPSGKFQGMLHYDWRHSESMNLAMVKGYLYHGYWQTLHLGSPSPTPPYLGDPSVHTYHHTNCMCKFVLRKENSCVLALYRRICLWIHIRSPWGTWPTRQLPAWIPLSTTTPGNFVKRLLEMM